MVRFLSLPEGDTGGMQDLTYSTEPERKLIGKFIFVQV
jgi:hypothetical protein